ncbi:amnion associated transmembrane protein [Anticarsia gemmatalis]|uniref:amnion associated transmembrane protein n=1 Tax=Anticarsia gemmatalis TaxID=129554 RepID=UPI003F75BBE7
MSSIILLQCIATIIVCTSAATVTWLPNSSFKLPENYKDGKLPCSKQTLVFPELVVGSISIADTELTEMILPEEGELILDDILTLGADPAEKNCTDGNAYYIDKTSSSWNQAGVWYSPSFSEATPDSDRVPCFNDIVKFPSDARITVTLPKETQYVKSLYIGDESFTTEQFRQRILQQSEQRQQFVLNEFSTTGLEIGKHMTCTDFGCPCQVVPMKIDCSSKFCPKPTCVDPIKPLGFCCEICGGSILFDADKGFDMLSFSEFVAKYTKDSAQFHIGFAAEIPIRRIQLVVVDKSEYDGSSAEIINSINYNMLDHWYKGPKLASISGSPISRAGLGVKIFVSMFFAVALSLIALYVYYYKVPEVRIPGMSRVVGGSMFSRFQNRSDSIVSLTRRDSVVSTARGPTAFRNPLYDSKRGRVQVEETVVED